MPHQRCFETLFAVKDAALDEAWVPVLAPVGAAALARLAAEEREWSYCHRVMDEAAD